MIFVVFILCLSYYHLEFKLNHQLLGTYMADHPDRHTCGRCGNMFYKLTKDGKRMPIPKQNKPVAATKAEAAPAKAAAKGKKK